VDGHHAEWAAERALVADALPESDVWRGRVASVRGTVCVRVRAHQKTELLDLTLAAWNSDLGKARAVHNVRSTGSSEFGNVVSDLRVGR
jgi:hypothetical protein